MPVPDFQSLMLPVLIGTASGEIGAPDLREKVAQSIALSEADQAEMLPSGRQTTFSNRAAWANVFLQRAGLIERVKRGTYRITKAGTKVLEEKPARIDTKYLERFPEFTEWRKQSQQVESADDATTSIGGSQTESPATPEETIERSFLVLDEALRAELIERVHDLSPAFFERLVIDLLVAMGYGGGKSEMGKAVGRSGDGGIDGIIKEDSLGLDVVYVQAKRYAAANTIGRPEVQGFAGSLDGERATKGIFITTSAFTSAARDYVGRIPKRIILIDGKELTRLMIQHGVGVRPRVTYQIKRVDEDYFAE